MNRISHFLLKRLTGRISPAEAEELDRWVTESDANRELHDRLTCPSSVKKMLDRWWMVDHSRACTDMQRRVNAILWRSRIRTITAVAVMTALICGISLYFRGHNYNTTQLSAQHNTSDTISVSDIKPGTTQAILSDTSGHSVRLNASDTTALSGDLLASTSAGASNKASQLCLDVPRGGEFKILLEDGTEVWLNSASRLYYPDTFADSVRRVSIEGEAYFSVEPDSLRPFVVTTGLQEVKVYGTKFNIRHYPEDNFVYTTLESGIVSIRRADKIGGELHLSPGHQSIFNIVDTKVNVKPVDTEIVTSWRKGRFVFENQSLYHIMLDLSRWYDFEYEFSDPSLCDEVFMGSIPRYADFTTAIAILEKCGGISFSTADNRVVISRL